MSIKTNLAAFGVAAAALTGSVAANAEVIHFNLPATEVFVPSPYIQDGVKFTTPDGQFLNWKVYGASSYNAESGAGTTLTQNFGGAQTVVSLVNGNSFSFSGIGFADGFNSTGGGSLELDFLHANGVIDREVVTLQNIKGLQSFAFNENNLSSVTILNPTTLGGWYQFDNANVTPTSSVPEPATWALMGVGLGGLALLGRRKAARAAAPAPV